MRTKTKMFAVRLSPQEHEQAFYLANRLGKSLAVVLRGLIKAEIQKLNIAHAAVGAGPRAERVDETAQVRRAQPCAIRDWKSRTTSHVN
jgi:predicted DNA-binding protein